MDLTAVGLLLTCDSPAFLAVCALIGVALLVSLPLVGAVLLVESLDLCRARALFFRLPAQRIKILGCALCLFDQLVGRCRNAARFPIVDLFVLVGDSRLKPPDKCDDNKDQNFSHCPRSFLLQPVQNVPAFFLILLFRNESAVVERLQFLEPRFGVGLSFLCAIVRLVGDLVAAVVLHNAHREQEIVDAHAEGHQAPDGLEADHRADARDRKQAEHAHRARDDARQNARAFAGLIVDVSSHGDLPLFSFLFQRKCSASRCCIAHPPFSFPRKKMGGVTVQKKGVCIVCLPLNILFACGLHCLPSVVSKRLGLLLSPLSLCLRIGSLHQFPSISDILLYFIIVDRSVSFQQIQVDISHILGNLITVIFNYQILRKPLKILSL